MAVLSLFLLPFAGLFAMYLVSLLLANCYPQAGHLKTISILSFFVLGAFSPFVLIQISRKSQAERQFNRHIFALAWLGTFQLVGAVFIAWGKWFANFMS